MRKSKMSTKMCIRDYCIWLIYKNLCGLQKWRGCQGFTLNKGTYSRHLKCSCCYPPSPFCMYIVYGGKEKATGKYCKQKALSPCSRVSFRNMHVWDRKEARIYKKGNRFLKTFTEIRIISTIDPNFFSAPNMHVSKTSKFLEDWGRGLWTPQDKNIQYIL